MRDLSFLVDDERGPLDAHVFLSIVNFFLPHSIGFDDFLVRVREQRKVQVELTLELLVRVP